MVRVIRLSHWVYVLVVLSINFSVTLLIWNSRLEENQKSVLSIPEDTKGLQFISSFDISDNHSVFVSKPIAS